MGGSSTSGSSAVKANTALRRAAAMRLRGRRWLALCRHKIPRIRGCASAAFRSLAVRRLRRLGRCTARANRRLDVRAHGRANLSMAAASAKAAGGSSWQAALRRHKPHDAPALVELERNSLADLKLAQHAVRHEPRNQYPSAAVGGTHVAEPCVKVQLGHCAGLRAGSWEKGCVYGRLIVEVGGLEGGVRGAGAPSPSPAARARAGTARSLHLWRARRRRTI